MGRRNCLGGGREGANVVRNGLVAFVAEVHDGEISCDDGPGHGSDEAGDTKKTVHSCNYLILMIMPEGKIGGFLYTRTAQAVHRGLN